MQNNLITGKRIAIIGGGPGGLTLAKLLQMNGAELTVYERDINEHARPKGATLDLHHGSGLAALEKTGLMEAFRANYRPEAGYIRILDKAAQIHFDEHINGDDGFNRPEIDRGPLNEILYQSLSPGTVVWNSHFVKLNRDKNVLQLEFKDGKSVTADIIIGADGANSKIRPYITSITPVYTGQLMLEATVAHSKTACPNMHNLVKGGKIFAFGEGKTIVLSSKGDGSLVIYLGIQVHEEWVQQSGINFSSREQFIRWFKEAFANWDAAWIELFQSATMPVIPRPQYCMPLDQWWRSLPDITMIGDAAHVMPPSAGEGVNMAMLDALELSECLLSGQHADIPSALAGYEKQMHIRMAEIGQQTLENAAWMSGPDALSIMVNFFNQLKEYHYNEQQ